MEYRLSNHSGDLFFELKENNEEQYLQITQSKNLHIFICIHHTL